MKPTDPPSDPDPLAALEVVGWTIFVLASIYGVLSIIGTLLMAGR